MTKFVPKIEKKCDTHFKKECDITYNEEVKLENVRVCSKKPQRKCDLTEEEKEIFNVTEISHAQCRIHYETGKFWFTTIFKGCVVLSTIGYFLGTQKKLSSIV